MLPFITLYKEAIMRARRFRLTRTAKILLVLVIIAALGGGVFQGLRTGRVTTGKENLAANNTITETTTANKNTTASDPTINLSLDEWVGWKSIIDANGGLTTQPGSIYDNLGIKVNISIINDATQSSNALIKGNLNAAGYTINRVAFLSNKFEESGVDVVMPYITNYSNGGDGIIATNDYQTVESLVNARIGVPQFSEAHSLVVWFVNQSDLNETDRQHIIDNLIFFETPDTAAKAFFAGEIDVAATWQPYLTQAQNLSDCHVFFSTASSTRLILDGILFREDFAAANPAIITCFIDGALQAMDLYDTEFEVVRGVMPMFSGMSDEDIREMTMDAALTGWNNNVETLQTEAPAIFYDMCEVWASVGEHVNPAFGEGLFDTYYMMTLADTYEYAAEATTTSNNVITVTAENTDQILDTTALLTKSSTVNFIINTAKFTDTAEAAYTLDDFIKVARLLDGTIIQIEGNTDPNPNTDPTDEANLMLSKQRAETVKQYFIMNGISADRIITVGNGSAKPVVSNDSEENRALNRRTDVSFKIIE